MRATVQIRAQGLIPLGQVQQFLADFARFDAASAPSVPVMPGQRSVNANASVSWEIGPR